MTLALEKGHHGLLGMEPVLGLLEDGVGMTLKEFGRDLLATVGRQAMEDMGIG
jgi:hypothetical protein